MKATFILSEKHSKKHFSNFALLLAMLLLTLLPLGNAWGETITLNGNISQTLSCGTTYTFYDSGGSSGNYSNSENFTATFTSSSGGPISITFSSFATESTSSSNWDNIKIYDGTTSGTQLVFGCTGYTSLSNAASGFQYLLTTGTTYTANSGTMTIVWKADGSNTAAGWVATLAPVCPATIPYTCNFENTSENGSWVKTSGGTDGWCVGSATYSSSSKSLYVSADGGSTNTYGGANHYIYAYREITFSSVGQHLVSYKWKCQGESSCDYMRVFLVPKSINPNLTSGQANSISTSGAPSSWVAVDGNTKLNLNSSWTTVNQTVDISATGNYYLVFYWRTDGSWQGNDGSHSSQNPPAAVDDISITKPCTSRTLTFASSSPSVELFNTITNAATTTGGGTVSYSSGNTSIATVSGSSVTGVGPGSATITASVPANGNYCAASATSTVTVTTPVSAPTSANTSPNQVYLGGTSTLSATGGYAGVNTNYYWYKSCPQVAYINHFRTAPGTYQSTVNSCTNGILNISSTGGDPQIYLYNVGSFSANTYRYIQIRYRVVSGNAGNIQVFYQGTGFTSLDENHSKQFTADNSGEWRMAVMDMSSSYWTSTGNITGFRFDYCGGQNCTMEIDYIALVSEECICMGSSVQTTVTEPANYYTLVIGENGVSSCCSTSATVSLKAPTISQTTVPVCGENAVFTASNGGATIPSGYSYHWFTDANCTNEITSGLSGANNSVLTRATNYGDKIYCRLQKTAYNIETGSPENFECNGSVQTYQIPANTSSLKLEVWGAQGGSYSSSYYGGYGGYSVGTWNDPTPGQTLYVVVGGQPDAYTTTPTTGGASINGGYNGGGSAVVHYWSSEYTLPQGGGGATHIATADGILSSLSGNQDAVLIVAGGGSGAAYSTSGSCAGYAGGGATPGAYSDTYRASLTAPGNGGSFGQGASYTSGTAYKFGPAGGGGGWYGGGNAQNYNDTYSEYLVKGHGGGSGYLKSTLVNASTTNGQRTGSGYARITPTLATPYIVATPVCGAVATCSACHNLGTPTVTQTNAIRPQCGVDNATFTASINGSVPSGYTYHWYTNAACTNEITTGLSGANNCNLTYLATEGITIYCRLEYRDTRETEISYSGSVVSYKVPEGTTTLLMQAWGAQGGSSQANANFGAAGGKGGYSVGTLSSPAAGTTLYVGVGGQGTNASVGSNSPGGFNGGGRGTWDNHDDESAGGGGGATHIATADGILSSLSSNQSSVLLVAGGGGGACWTSSGGAGGGTSPGAGAGSGTILYGSFGRGADAEGVGDNDGVGGGGGGWQGGNAYNTTDGASYAAGGSGYVNTNRLSGTSTSNGQREGNGHVLFTATIECNTPTGQAELVCQNCYSTNLAYTTTSVSVGYLTGTYTNNTLTSNSGIPSNVIEYRSSDNSIATVGANGQVTFVRAGTVTITAYVLNNTTYCDSEAEYTLTINCPSISAPSASNNERCGSGTVTLSANPGNGGTTCRWYSSNTSTSILGTGDQYTTPSINATTTYYVATYDEASGCESPSRTSVTATVHPAFTPGTVSGSESVCHGDNRSFTISQTAANGKPTISYKWYLDGTEISGATSASYTLPGNTVAGLAAGTHTVTRAALNNCGTTAQYTSEGAGQFTLKVKPVLSASVSGNTELYCGDAATLTANSTFAASTHTYEWRNEGTVVSTSNPFTTPLLHENTRYTLKAVPTNSNDHCPSVEYPVNITVGTDEEPVVTQQGLNCPGSTITLSVSNPKPGRIYQWSTDANFGSVAHEGADYSFAVPNSTVQYYVRSVRKEEVTRYRTEVSEGTAQPFSYTGGVQTYTVPANTSSLYLQVWGAQGGSYNATYYGGKGGYSAGSWNNPTPGQTLYVVVGGQPASTGTTAPTTGSTTDGGYNGGGKTVYHYWNSSSVTGWTLAQGGGGATHIATADGVLSSLSSNQDAVLIVAGGGSGAIYCYGNSSDCGLNGYVGFTGYDGGGTISNGYSDEYKATQADPGTGGSFGQGATNTSTSWRFGPGGGGGGWYGGGVTSNSSDTYSEAQVRSSAGGSGYLKSYLTGTTALNGSRAGNGYAVITPTISEQVAYTEIVTVCPSGSTSVTITPIAAPTVTASSDANGTVCPGIGITLSASATTASSGVNFEWHTGSQTGTTIGTTNPLSVNPNATTNYYVKVTESDGCRRSVWAGPVTVNVYNFTPGTISGSGTVCEGTNQSFSVTTTAATGKPTISYKWYLDNSEIAGATSAGYTLPGNTVANLSAGAHTLTREALNNCASQYVPSSGSFTLTVGAIPAPPQISALEVCDGDPSILSVVNANTSHTYSWYDANNNQITNVVSTIENGTSSSSTSPIDACYKNGWTEAVYHADELNIPVGSINSIAFYINASSAWNPSELTIYMANSDKTGIASTTDWTPLSSLTQVYSGTPSFTTSTTGWYTFNLDAPFAYDGRNLVIAVSHKATAYNCSVTLRYSNSSESRFIYRHNDEDATYGNHPGSNTGTLYAYLYDIKLNTTISPNATSYTTPELTAGNYYIYYTTETATYNGVQCTSSPTEVKVTVHNNPTVNSVTTNQSGITCKGTPITLTANVTAGDDDNTDNWDYYWTAPSGGGASRSTGSSNTCEMTPTAGNVYTQYAVKVTDGNGCSATLDNAASVIAYASVNVTANPSTALDAGNAVTLTAKPYTNTVSNAISDCSYDWSTTVTTGAMNTSGTNHNVCTDAVAATATYAVTATVTAANCTVTGSKTVYVKPNAGGDNSCETPIIYCHYSDSYGSDDHDGSATAPVKTLQRALSLAAAHTDRTADNPAIIRMAGSYSTSSSYYYNINESAQLIDNVVIDGGWYYNANTGVWTKNNSYITTINRTNANVERDYGAPRLVAIEGSNKSGFKLQDVTVKTAAAPTTSGQGAGYSTKIPTSGTTIYSSNVTTGFMVYDNNQFSGYSNSWDGSLVLKPANGGKLSVSGTVNVEGGYDYISVYSCDAEGNSQEDLFTGRHGSGTSIQTFEMGPYTSTNASGCLKIRFYSDGSTGGAGAQLTITEEGAGAGVSTYAMHLSDCSGYELVRCKLQPGNASAGLKGAYGGKGSPGSAGSQGTQGGSNTSNSQASGGSAGNGGGAGSSFGLAAGAGGNGGAGGNSRSTTAASNGNTGGQSGSGTSGGSGGTKDESWGAL